MPGLPALTQLSPIIQQAAADPQQAQQLLMAAASAFSSLSSELSSNAASYEAVISQLVGSEWLGPSSASMAAAAQPYIAWLNTTSGQLQEAAAKAMASAAAYETAFMATVPPPVIAANRAQLAALVATNILGQNTPAIMA
ncbi:PPE family protein, partial [Mycobacterium celatum]|uniref:PPE family protein n=1 Tax=Mycobacterium celatum TaxID=28045 RepID=UPI0012ECE5F3